MRIVLSNPGRAANCLCLKSLTAAHFAAMPRLSIDLLRLPLNNARNKERFNLWCWRAVVNDLRVLSGH